MPRGLLCRCMRVYLRALMWVASRRMTTCARAVFFLSIMKTILYVCPNHFTLTPLPLLLSSTATANFTWTARRATSHRATVSVHAPFTTPLPHVNINVTVYAYPSAYIYFLYLFLPGGRGYPTALHRYPCGAHHQSEHKTKYIIFLFCDTNFSYFTFQLRTHPLLRCAWQMRIAPTHACRRLGACFPPRLRHFPLLPTFMRRGVCVRACVTWCKCGGQLCAATSRCAWQGFFSLSLCVCCVATAVMPLSPLLFPLAMFVA